MDLIQKLKEAESALRIAKSQGVGWIRRPEVLTHPTIPEPLHGLAPRAILGAGWWAKTRKLAAQSTGNCCVACGIHANKARFHKWVEGHEMYDIDYLLGTSTYVETVPLCHACHNYIHSGRLEWLLGARQITMGRFVTIMRHGNKVLQEAGLQKLKPYSGPSPKWSDWRLILYGKPYKPLYSSEDEWRKAYGYKP